MPTKAQIRKFVHEHLDEFYVPKTGLYDIEQLAIEASHYFETSLSLGEEPLDQYIEAIEEVLRETA